MENNPQKNLNPDAGVSNAPVSISLMELDHLGFSISENMNGWIRLYRGWEDHWIHPLSEKRPFTKYEAWIDMLFLANYEQRKILFNGSFIIIERGTFISSILKLSDRWHWSRGKTRGFIKLLQHDTMIETKTNQHCTQIIICNYAKYQFLEPTDNQQITNRKPTESQQKAITNELNELNKININDEVNFETPKPVELENPQKPKKRERKLSEEEYKIYSSCVSIYNDFILKISDVPAKIDGKQAKNLKSIISFLQAVNKNKNGAGDICIMFKYVLDNYNLWNKFCQEGISLSQINSNLQNIIKDIKVAKETEKTKLKYYEGELI